MIPSYLNTILTILSISPIAYVPTSAAKYSDARKLRNTANSFRNFLKKKGYTVRDGNLKFFFTNDDCHAAIDAVGTCFGNNPEANPYGVYQLPHIPGEAIDDLVPSFGGDRTNDGFGLEIRIRSDEAIVLMGVTPPKAEYFGYTHYLYRSMDRRIKSDGAEGPTNFTTILASLDDTLNPTTIRVKQNKKRYKSSFGKDVVITTTGHKGTAKDVQKALKQAGVSNKIVNLQKISIQRNQTSAEFTHTSTGLYNAGLDADKDTLMLLSRVAIFQNETAGNRYLQNPPVLVFRVTPNQPVTITLPQPSDDKHTELTPQPHYPTPNRAERTTRSEEIFRTALDTLENAVRAAHTIRENFGAQVLPLDGNHCIRSSISCVGDNPDTAYAVSATNVTLPQSLTNDESSSAGYFVVIGVNHAATNSSQYSELGSIDLRTGTGVASFDNRRMPGSAEPYLLNETTNDASGDAAKYLYAIMVRRNCTGILQRCVEIPSPPTFPNVGFDDPILFVFRAVLSPRGLSGPDPSALLPARVLYAHD